MAYGNGIYASFGYSTARLQLDCLDYSTTNRNGVCAHDATTKLGLNYGYAQAGGNNGQITSITDSVDSGRSVTYSYDALYRLRTAVTTGSAQYAQWGLSWTYDRYGNRLSQTKTHGAPPENSLSFANPGGAQTNRPDDHCFDANGNLLAEAAAPCPAPNYTYDGENRLVTLSGTNQAAYVYDGASLRVKKCVPNCASPTTTTVYIFSGAKVIAEYVNGALNREYVYSGSVLLAVHEGSALKYRISDHLSARLITDNSGTVLVQSGHYPFGESWYETGGGTKLKFTSYERDAESGNDFAIFRYHISRMGRFNSPDSIAGSIGDPQSLNRFDYAKNDPANRVDPLGLDDTGACQGGECQVDEAFGGGGTCMMDGMLVPCGYAMSFVQSGAAGIVPFGFSITGPNRVDYFGNGLWADPRWFSADGRFTPAALLERAGLTAVPFLFDPFSQQVRVQVGEPGTQLRGKEKLDAIIDTALNQPRLGECLQMFGPGIQLTRQNRPFIDASRDLGRTADGRVIAGQPLSYTGRGVVGISSPVYNDPGSSISYLAAVYLHEVGNYLANGVFGDPLARPLPDALLPYHGGDRDTGANFEHCLFQGQVLPNGQILRPPR